MTEKVNNLLVIKNFHSIGEPLSACCFKIFSNDIEVVKLHYKFSHFDFVCHDLSNGKHKNSKVHENLKNLQQNFIERKVSTSHVTFGEGQHVVHPVADGARSMRLSRYGMTNNVCEQEQDAAPSNRTKTPDFTVHPYQWPTGVGRSSDLLTKVTKNKIQKGFKKSSKPSLIAPPLAGRKPSANPVLPCTKTGEALPFPLVSTAGGDEEAMGGFLKVSHPFLLSGAVLPGSFKSAAFPVYREGGYPLGKAVLNRQPSLIWKRKSKRKTYKVVRPMLSCSRAEITKLCQSWKLPVYPDQSNDFTHYSRNRIRKQLLPAIRFFFNPKVENVIFQFTEIVADEQFLINKRIDHLLTVFPFFHLPRTKYPPSPLF